MTSKTDDKEYFVIAGILSDGKPHAARFPASEQAAVHKAAGQLNLRPAKAAGEAALKVVRKLPEGKIFAAGKALVPFVKTDLYNELLKVVTFDVSTDTPPSQTTQAKPANGSDKDKTPALPLDFWRAIKVGSVVLCRYVAGDEDPAWWECVVNSIGKDGDALTVRWRDYPKLKSFTVRRMSVGILPPEPPTKTP
jgi:hypothetical protein